MAKKLPPSRPQAPPDPGPLNDALLVTYGGEATRGLVECRLPPATQTIQDFTVTVQGVSARPSDPALNSYRARDIARHYFQAHDQREQPYLRVIGRVLDELLNHRRYRTCSGGDVYRVLLEELSEELPPAHRRVRRLPNQTLDVTGSTGRRVIDKRLTKLRGRILQAGAEPGVSLVVTTSTTRGGAGKGYRLTEDGQWLFDGWPELQELVRGRLRATEAPPR
jgi:hypothetical protein